jgi:hypothetical protein
MKQRQPSKARRKPNKKTKVSTGDRPKVSIEVSKKVFTGDFPTVSTEVSTAPGDFPSIANTPESQALTAEQTELYELARQAFVGVKRSFEQHWVPIIDAVLMTREIANKRGGRSSFMVLLEQQHLHTMGKKTASKLERIGEKLDSVLKWRETLTEEQRVDWASPSSVLAKCPYLRKRSEPESANPKPASDAICRAFATVHNYLKSADVDQRAVQLEKFAQLYGEDLKRIIEAMQ